MNLIVKRTFLFLGIFISATLLYVTIVLIYGTYTDWQPQNTLNIDIENPTKNIIQDSIIQVSIWNIGYAGLGAQSNFFFDNGDQFFSNGRMIRSPKNYVEKNIQGVKNLLQNHNSDFYLLQEVDRNSKRSYHIDQFQLYAQTLPKYTATFAANYKNDRVPLPIAEPWRVYGKVHSGLATYSACKTSQAQRIQLPGAFDWPTRVFQLDRCVLKTIYPFYDKKIVIFNVHNSAYDQGGQLKKQQLDFLSKLFIQEYQNGNYVIVGGDWNQVPPNFSYDKFQKDTQGYSQIPISIDAMPPGWTWVYDPNLPTNRKVRDVFDPDKTFQTLIDFFLISPNIQVQSVQTSNQNFEYSDHQPVHATFILN